MPNSFVHLFPLQARVNKTIKLHVNPLTGQAAVARASRMGVVEKGHICCSRNPKEATELHRPDRQSSSTCGGASSAHGPRIRAWSRFKDPNERNSGR